MNDGSGRSVKLSNFCSGGGTPMPRKRHPSVQARNRVGGILSSSFLRADHRPRTIYRVPSCQEHPSKVPNTGAEATLPQAVVDSIVVRRVRMNASGGRNFVARVQ